MKEVLIDGGILFISLSIQAYIQSYILQFIFDLKFNTSKRLAYSVILGIYGSIAKLFLPINLSSLNPIFALLITTGLLKYYNSDRSVIKCFVYTTVIMLLGAPIEIISGLIIFQIFHLPSNVDNVVATIPVLLMIDLWHGIIACIIYFIKKKSNIIFRFNNKSTYLNIIFAFLFLAPNIIFYTMNRYNYPLYLLIYNAFANLFLVILTIYNTYNSLQLNIKKKELENSELHNKTLSALIDNIRVFKHDYNNVVHAIGGYILLNDMDGLKKYYNGLSKDSQKVNQLEAISPNIINEPSIYGLIASKYQIADLKHLNFNFESVFDYQNLQMPIYDFCKTYLLEKVQKLICNYFLLKILTPIKMLILKKYTKKIILLKTETLV